MSIDLSDGRQLSDSILEALRLRALHGCEQGYSEAMLADILGVCPETISRWWSAYQRGGLDAIPQERTGRPIGTSRTLDDQQAHHLQAIIHEQMAEACGMASPLWTRRAVRDLIHKEYGIDMPIRTVGEYLVFLNRLLHGASKKIFLIVDRLSAHGTPAVETWLREHEEQIEMFYLPSRAPELNPDESLNNDIHSGVNATKLPDTKKELRSNIQRFLHKLAKLPRRIMNYFANPYIQYAAAPAAQATI